MPSSKEQILACARDIFLSDGLDGLTMRKLAGRVGVTAPAIYRHYSGRDEVVADILREAHRTFSRYLYRALSEPTAQERFLRAGQGFLDFVVEHPRWYSMLFSGPEHLGLETLPPDVESMGSAIHQFWIDRVRECIDAGLLRPAVPEETSITLWAHAHGMVQLYHQGHLRMSEDAFRMHFKASGVRLMRGVASQTFIEELEQRQTLQAGAVVVETPRLETPVTTGSDWI